ncbi:Nuclear envelope pore membrane protein POM 121 [Merluccius polli]|uniref:Nuclear envelope pore membrane protein POM 121 n=1 Tax=Merluccius polli TaxID=89951 RepID=A0AA47MZ90_MERPO|nr:Nuclear envelope pore membrane protein POM 121 [Merluccius polli]
MSPSEKQLISLISVAVLGVLVACLGLYFIPAFPYVTLILLFCCIVFYCLRGDSLYTKAGPHPRRAPGIPLLLRRWLAGGAAGEGRTRTRSHAQVDVRFSDVYTRQRRAHADTTAYPGDSSLFSPRDVLMGSYVSKEAPAERPPGAGRSWAANPREQLRERLSRPNHAVLTPNRRLSFTRESVASPGKFVITPQRHYPLLQSGTASVGVLPPAHWDSFKKKNILSPRNCTTLHSPVTVKIARPDHSTHRPPVLDYMCSPGLGLPPDPCSTEGVLKVLKESRKRDVVEEGDGSFTAEQHSKRRRNDSGGSAHSAFEPLLPNGMTSQLVPKPGTLKRGTNSVEEAAVKRSRTSSISSGSAAPAPGGTPGSARNPINSSYSSSRGLGKWKKTLEHGSPLSSPGSSRSQTPERALKKPREDDVQCPSSVSVVAPDKTATRIAAVTSKQTPVAKLGVRVSSESSSGGKRKRKIQLVSSHREDQIYLPPPPELGYTVTGKDLDLEKKDALSKIQKSLEEPVLEKPGVAPASLPSAQTGTFSSTTTLSSLLAAPLSTATTAPVSVGAPIPVINLDPTPTNSTPQPAAAAAPASNPLLEALKTKSITPSSLPSTTLGITVSSSGDTQTQKPAITLNSSQPTSSVLGQPTSSSAPSAFTQVLNQATKPVTSAPIISGTSLFGMASPLSTSSATPTSAPPAYAPPTASGTGSAGSSNSLLVSGFKPIFMATPPTSTAPPSAQDNKPTVPNFKSLFGSTGPSTAFGASPSVTMATTSPPTAPTANPTASFGGLNGSRNVTASSLFPGSASVASAVPTGATPSTTAQPAAQPAVKPLFGAWGASSTTSTASTSTLASNTGNTFQFGAAAAAAAAAAPVTTVAPSVLTTAAKTNSTFTFGSMVAAPTTTQATATQATPQNVFGFGQAAPTQNQPTASFGGFALANVPAAAATTAGTTAANNAPTTQSTFTFAKSAFDASAAPSAFPSLTSAAPKPFGFGTSTATAAPAPAPTTTPAPFSFGAGATSTTTSTFGTPAKPAFGAGSTGFPFGSTAAPAAAAAASTFGLSTQTQSAPPTSTFTFGSSAPQQTATLPSQPASGGFNFCSAVPSTQFGTPVSSNAAPQMASFNFGAATTDKPTFGTPTFGQSAAAGPTPFGSPATPIQSFSSAAPPPFGSPATPSFSIGAGSKPSGARQRLQARRQHTRKK